MAGPPSEPITTKVVPFHRSLVTLLLPPQVVEYAPGSPAATVMPSAPVPGYQVSWELGGLPLIRADDSGWISRNRGKCCGATYPTLHMGETAPQAQCDLAMQWIPAVQEMSNGPANCISTPCWNNINSQNYLKIADRLAMLL